MPISDITRFLEQIDPGVHRRIKGLRLVTAYGIAACLGALHDMSSRVPNGVSLSSLAGGFALWASVSESRATRADSSRDLLLLVAGAAMGALVTIYLAPAIAHWISSPPEATLVIGSFLAAYLRRFGIWGAGLGSQFYIGQLLAYGAGLGIGDLSTIFAATLIAVPAAIIPRTLSGPAEHPTMLASAAVEYAPRRVSPELAMGLQAAIGSGLVVALSSSLALEQSAWAITACTYVVTSTASGTFDRIRRRIVGTIIGVPLGLVCLPLAVHTPVSAWLIAALAMVVYAIALPERYEIACAAFAIALIVTLAASGEHSLFVLTSRLWETILGGALGVVTATIIFPLVPLNAATPHRDV